MKRDWNTIKCLLSKTEALAARATLTYSIDDDSEAVVGNAVLLVREGYIRGDLNGDIAVILDTLTMRGHDLLEKLRAQNGVR